METLWVVAFIIGVILYFAAMLLIVAVPPGTGGQWKATTALITVTACSLALIGWSYLASRGAA